MRHFLSLNDLHHGDLSWLIDRSLAIAQGDKSRPLAGKFVGIYFRRSSTRTRTAFTIGAQRAGAQVICYGPDDLQISTGETILDTGRVLSGFLDALVIRTNETIEEMMAFAEQNNMAVINAMSNNEHPSQAIADLVTIKEAFGRLDDLHILYVGDGNNTVAALALAVARLPKLQLTIVTPEGYGLTDSLLKRARVSADQNLTRIEQHHRIDRLPKNVDVVYTTRWQTMGEPKTDTQWTSKFEPFGITRSMMAEVSKPETSRSSRTIFLHDLPAVRGADVVNEVLDGRQSLAFRQAQHKMTSAMAVLEWAMN
jgi:ornithine carbamoyltransferase